MIDEGLLARLSALVEKPGLSSEQRATLGELQDALIEAFVLLERTSGSGSGRAERDREERDSERHAREALIQRNEELSAKLTRLAAEHARTLTELNRLRLERASEDRPPLFQVREPPRRFAAPLVVAVVLHVGVIGWTASRVLPSSPRAEPVRVALKLPVRKVAVNEPPGGGSERLSPPARRPRVHRRIVVPTVIPPPVVEEPPKPAEADPPLLAEAEDAGDDDGIDGAAGGTGTGSGPGVGPGQGSVKSKARKAWLVTTQWKCKRPGYEDLGRIVVRIRVQVLLDGRPGQVTVTKPGPEAFNRRAVDCAKDEMYLPALDAQGNPIPGAAEFGIEFMN